MKTTLVNIAAGATATNVRSTIPAKFVRIEEESAAGIPGESLIASLVNSDDSFSAEITYRPGEAIVLHNFARTVAVSPGLAYPSQTGGIYAKVRTLSGQATIVKLTEHEKLPPGNY